MRPLYALLTVGIVFLPVIARAYEVPTHEAITEAAGTASMVDQVLREDLELSDGLASSIGGQRLVEWLAQGGRTEDNVLRFLNHFHNPLADWSTAGLGDVGQSSILWGQNTTLSGWAWQDVRQAYFDALTGPTASARDANLARAFERFFFFFFFFFFVEMVNYH